MASRLCPSCIGHSGHAHTLDGCVCPLDVQKTSAREGPSLAEVFREEYTDEAIQVVGFGHCIKQGVTVFSLPCFNKMKMSAVCLYFKVKGLKVTNI